jgi:NAD(P)-dependent dehydrogenase (short-subunit alcohol dehydrogenase family)
VKGLVLSARNGARLEQTAKEARQLATNPDFETLVVLCDISNEGEIVNLITKSVEKFGVIDYAVNNAGVRDVQSNTESESAQSLTKKEIKFIAQKAIPFATISTEEMDKLANTNARGSFLCTREQIKVMLTQPRKDIKGLTSTTNEAERGCIVNVSSQTALGAMPYCGSYVPTTWSRLGMTKSAGRLDIKLFLGAVVINKLEMKLLITAPMVFASTAFSLGILSPTDSWRILTPHKNLEQS